MIYLDMDDVIADFCGHIRTLGIPRNTQWHDPSDTWSAETKAGELVKKQAMHTPGFWAAIPPMPKAKLLWDFIGHLDPEFGVLTAKPHADSPAMVGEEKLVWCNTILGPLPAHRFFCVERKDKQAYARLGSYPNVLIDDSPKNISEWNAAGGIGMLHTDVETTISRLTTLLNG